MQLSGAAYGSDRLSSLTFALLYNGVELDDVSIATKLLMEGRCTVNPCSFTRKMCEKAIATIKRHGDELYALRSTKVAEAADLPEGEPLGKELSETLSVLDERLTRFATVKDYLTRVKLHYS